MYNVQERRKDMVCGHIGLGIDGGKMLCTKLLL